MQEIQKIVGRLIETGESFAWEDFSDKGKPRSSTFGRVKPQWTTWVGRIENILKAHVKPNTEPFIYFDAAKNTAIEGNFRGNFESAKENYLKSMVTVKDLLEEDIFDDLLSSKTETLKIKLAPIVEKKAQDTQSNKKVFIVHGHDHSLKVELEVFLSHIGLTPIVLHREVDGGQTIIEKFEANSDVAYAFILLTPDEIAYAKDQENIIDEKINKEARARPNVIFEFGYFIAKLGRKKVCALHKGDVAIPSDLGGFIYKKVDESIEEIGFSLIKELKAAGLKPEI